MKPNKALQRSVQRSGVAARRCCPPAERRAFGVTPRNLEGARVTRDTEVDLKVIRIVCNIESQDLAQAHRFYGDILGLDLMMDLGWIRTYGSKETKPVQISMLSEGGSGTPVPELSIEVDDIEEAARRIRAAKLPIEYGPADEPWGVRRFYVRDPFGKLINVLAHT